MNLCVCTGTLLVWVPDISFKYIIPFFTSFFIYSFFGDNIMNLDDLIDRILDAAETNKFSWVFS